MTSLLLTSDWQVDLHNLDHCEVMLKELISQAKEHNVAGIIHAGDVKDPYSPIGVGVAKFGVRSTRMIRDAGFRYIVNLGNHDRVSQSQQSEDWLSILAAAGAEVVTSPTWKKIDKLDVAFLPYTGNKRQERLWAKKLRMAWPVNRAPKVLIFHTTICGAQFDNGAIAGDTENGYKDLHMHRYDACFGGHLHTHQKLRTLPVWYIGSPFSHDWNEANETKGHLLVEF